MKILVIGGTRFIGRHLVELLLEKGHEVKLFHRGQTNAPFSRDVEHIIGDRVNLREHKETLLHHKFDALVAYSHESA